MAGTAVRSAPLRRLTQSCSAFEPPSRQNRQDSPAREKAQETGWPTPRQPIASKHPPNHARLDLHRQHYRRPLYELATCRFLHCPTCERPRYGSGCLPHPIPNPSSRSNPAPSCVYTRTGSGRPTRTSCAGHARCVLRSVRAMIRQLTFDFALCETHFYVCRSVVGSVTSSCL